MGGVTGFGLRYPTLDDVVDATSWQHLAEDIEAALAAMDTKRTLARNRPSASINSADSVTAGVVTNCSFTSSKNWDNAGLVPLPGLGRIDMTSTGIWLVTVQSYIQSFTTCTGHRLNVTVNGVLHSGNKVDAMFTAPATSVTNGDNRMVAIVVNMSASNYLGASIHWTGTGGPADTGTRLAVIKLRDL